MTGTLAPFMAPALEGLGPGEHVMQIFWAKNETMLFKWCPVLRGHQEA